MDELTRSELARIAARHRIAPGALRELESLLEALTDPRFQTIDLGSPSAESAPTPTWDRYEDRGMLGRGGMGEVRRVYDRVLERDVAMKTLQGSSSDEARARFREEVLRTAGLSHPGVIPVYDGGHLPDGRAWFTMKEVQGRTLGVVVREVHAASGPEGWGSAADGTGLWRLIDHLRQACMAVSYAHGKGVLHRDLKPQNIMIGRYGEVLVLDWGLSRGGVSGGGSRQATRAGAVAGTPSYMPPEQARGELAGLGPQADVYSLGACLYEVLAGEAPYAEHADEDVILAVLAGPPRTFPAPGAPPAPEELVAVCARAMARRPEDRFPSMDALASALDGWLQGARRREEALELIEAARVVNDALTANGARIHQLEEEARALKTTLHPLAPIPEKRPLWALEDQLEQLGLDSALHRVRVEQLLQAALSRAPDAAQARELLADHYRGRVEEAEARGAVREAAAAEAWLRRVDRGRHARWLEGKGRVSLETNPPRAEVEIFRLVDVDRRLQPALRVFQGETPVFDLELPRGSYLALLRAPGRILVRYPFVIERESTWDRCPPEEPSRPRPIWLPEEGALREGERFVPAGWFQAGGDAETHFPYLARRAWIEDFAIAEHPITFDEMVYFLNALRDAGHEDEALRLAPRERIGALNKDGPSVLGRSAEGRFLPPEGARGVVIFGDQPAGLSTWTCASRYAAWAHEQTGMPYRLPLELEWEKAARGVDGRAWPWGNRADPTFCATIESTNRPMRRTEFPQDETIYGVRGMGGNIRDWCAELWDEQGPPVVDGRPAPQLSGTGLRPNRGGSWGGRLYHARCCVRQGHPEDFPMSLQGFRLARSLDPQTSMARP